MEIMDVQSSEASHPDRDKIKVTPEGANCDKDLGSGEITVNCTGDAKEVTDGVVSEDCSQDEADGGMTETCRGDSREMTDDGVGGIDYCKFDKIEGGIIENCTGDTTEVIGDGCVVSEDCMDEQMEGGISETCTEVARELTDDGSVVKEDCKDEHASEDSIEQLMNNAVNDLKSESAVSNEAEACVPEENQIGIMSDKVSISDAEIDIGNEFLSNIFADDTKKNEKTEETNEENQKSENLLAAFTKRNNAVEESEDEILLLSEGDIIDDNGAENTSEIDDDTTYNTNEILSADSSLATDTVTNEISETAEGGSLSPYQESDIFDDNTAENTSEIYNDNTENTNEIQSADSSEATDAMMKGQDAAIEESSANEAEDLESCSEANNENIDEDSDQPSAMEVDMPSEITEGNVSDETSTNVCEEIFNLGVEGESAAVSGSDIQESAMEVSNDVAQPSDDAEVLPEKLEATEVIPEISDAAEVLPEISDTAEVLPEISDAAEVLPEISDTAEVLPETLEAAEVLPETSDAAELLSETSDAADVLPETSEAGEVLPETSDDADVVPETSDAAEVLPETSDASEVLPEISDAAEVLPETSDAAEVLPETSEAAKERIQESESDPIAMETESSEQDPTPEETNAGLDPAVQEEDVVEDTNIKDGDDASKIVNETTSDPVTMATDNVPPSVDEANTPGQEAVSDYTVVKPVKPTQEEVGTDEAAKDGASQLPDIESSSVSQPDKEEGGIPVEKSEVLDTDKDILTRDEEVAPVKAETSPVANEISQTEEGATDTLNQKLDVQDGSGNEASSKDESTATAEESSTLAAADESSLAGVEEIPTEVFSRFTPSAAKEPEENKTIDVDVFSKIVSKPTAEDNDIVEINVESNHVNDNKDNAENGETKMDTTEDTKVKTKEKGGSDKLVGTTDDENDIRLIEPADLGIKIAAVSGAVDKVEDSSEKKELNKAVKKEENHKDSTTTKDSLRSAKKDDNNVIKLNEDKRPPKSKPTAKIQTCIVCFNTVKCKYNIVRNGDVKHLCDDTCFKRFKQSPTTYLRQANNVKTPEITAEPTPPPASTNNTATAKTQTKAPVVNSKATAAPVTTSYKTCNVCQLMNVRTSKPFLNWLGQDYCGEDCLGKFQAGISTACAFCSSNIPVQNKARWVRRVGDEVKGFCGVGCLNEFSKRMKLCAFCNKDLLKIVDSFMAPVGSQGMFKDFCSQSCLQKFEDKNNNTENGSLKSTKATQSSRKAATCAVCAQSKPVKHQFKLAQKWVQLCSDPCLSAYQYANKVTLNTCESCGIVCTIDNGTTQSAQFEGQQKLFCSHMCVTSFKTSHSKVVPCSWCETRKTNFDMIERVDAKNKYQLFCSLSCLSLYRVNLQATSNQAVTCDQCRKFVPAQYHLTMSDASVRNFCSYGCVMQFQAQFQTPKSQQQQPTQNQANKTSPVQQQATTRSGRVVKGAAAAVIQHYQQPTPKGKASAGDSGASIPVISNVMSLAPSEKIPVKQPTAVNKATVQPVVKTQTTVQVQQQIIIQPPPPKMQKNKAVQCKPATQTKAASCRPHTQTKDMQTEGKPEPEKIFIPVPVPVYIPCPLSMYSLPTPVMVPVPVPIPVPVFIPTTKKSAGSIMKQIKEIQERIPADPLEAELLMMAEAVAEKDPDSGSSSDEAEPEAEEVKELPKTKEATPVPAGPPSGGDLGEDMLQMAIRMASEMSEEPVMDLETSLEPVAVNTVPPQSQSSPAVKELSQEEDEEEYIPARQTRRGRSGAGAKRTTRSTPRRNTKRQKVEPVPELKDEKPESPAQPAAPPPDANFHLKYTYGVNAFKHWVLQKNTHIEQIAKPTTGRPPKLFKMDILQSTADELNYALCLFVKEVRKPNGEEYAVDSIYYLCLGIQQYLFESGRIDNIFTDIYYERFTESLNEILTRYEPKLNHAGQLVCRIEEEHLWESKQLGAHSPHVLLNSLVYFNTKYFMLKTSEDHLKLSFTHIMKHWKKTASGRGSGTGPNAGRSVYLRYYCPAAPSKDNNAQKKKKEEMPVYEQAENLDNPLRCPVKLYEFYLSKCPESIKNRNDTFYLVPERSCVPDSPVWYSTSMLGIDQMAKMLNRVRLVREIQEAHLHTQPIYI